MASDDFTMLATYIDKKGKGQQITFYEDANEFIVKFSDDMGDLIHITFFNESVGSFAKVTKTRRLSEELQNKT